MIIWEIYKHSFLPNLYMLKKTEVDAEAKIQN